LPSAASTRTYDHCIARQGKPKPNRVILGKRASISSSSTIWSIMDELQAIVDNRRLCASFYVRTPRARRQEGKLRQA
jgi:hypothetical protein